MKDKLPPSDAELGITTTGSLVWAVKRLTAPLLLQPRKQSFHRLCVCVFGGFGGGREGVNSVGTQPRQELVKAEKQKLAATSPLAIPRDDVHRNWWQLPPRNGFKPSAAAAAGGNDSGVARGRARKAAVVRYLVAGSGTGRNSTSLPWLRAPGTSERRQ